jgi:hypothetical protein
MSLVDQPVAHLSRAWSTIAALRPDHRAARRRLCHRTVRGVQRHRLTEFIGIDFARYHDESEIDVVGRTTKQESGAGRWLFRPLMWYANWSIEWS